MFHTIKNRTQVGKYQTLKHNIMNSNYWIIVCLNKKITLKNYWGLEISKLKKSIVQIVMMLFRNFSFHA